MHITCEPALSTWRLGRATAGAGGQATIATGHQAWLWHPGILAKYLALHGAAAAHGADAVNVIVDHDVYDALRLDVPVVRGQRLAVHTMQLGAQTADVPVGAQPAVDASQVVARLRRLPGEVEGELAADIQPIIDAWHDLPDAPDLAAQMTQVLDRLMAPFAIRPRHRRATDLLRTERAEAAVEHMLRDAAGCVRAYNDAAAAHPHAGITLLTIERERVELPLWCVRFGEPRRRVFADLADSTPMLTDETGRPIEVAKAQTGAGLAAGAERLAPRALLLTALMRSAFCDLFIHGRGGGVYDQVMEQWWTSWTGESLSPMAVVSADVHLDFGVPVAHEADLTRAVWWRHHLPHNIDRALDGRADAPLVARKRNLLATMDHDRDRARRAAAFAEIHHINDHLAEAHRHLLTAADRRLEAARAGVHNAHLAARRDWCFALYPRQRLRELADHFSTSPRGTTTAPVHVKENP